LAWGFLTETSSSITLDLGSGTAATEEMDGWYGWIELADFEITIDGDLEEGQYLDETSTAQYLDLHVVQPDVTAKIVNGPLSIKIAGVDGYEAGKLDAIEGDEDDDYPVEDDETGVDVATDLTDPDGSLTIAFDNDMLGVALSIATENDWTAGNDPDNDSFLIGLDASVTAGPATIGVNAAKALNVDANDLGFGAKVDLDLDPLAIYVGFDGDMDDVLAFDWETGGGVSVGIGDDITISLDALYGSAVDMDGELAADAAFGDLTLGVDFGIYDLTATMEFDAGLEVGYAIGDVASISVDGGFGQDEAAVTYIPLEVAVDLTVIPNTTFTFKYASDDLNVDNGVISAACKIEY
jgi:hypothetical protein